MTSRHDFTACCKSPKLLGFERAQIYLCRQRVQIERAFSRCGTVSISPGKTGAATCSVVPPQLEKTAGFSPFFVPYADAGLTAFVTLIIGPSTFASRLIVTTVMSSA